METTVYILYFGEESERQVGGVYSTRAAAEAAMRFGDAFSHIVAFGVDAPLPEGPATGSLWFVSYDVQVPEFIVYQLAAFGPHGKPDVVRRTTHDDLEVHVWARDKAEAHAKGVDHFSRFLAAEGATSVLARMKAGSEAAPA